MPDVLLPQRDGLEMWGGIECSCIRICDEWRDEVRETGHYARATDDIDAVAALGIRTVRYPVLWEQTPPDNVDRWGWHDRQFAALERHGMSVVAGLVHHGSGPGGTGLLDPLFPEKLAAHAGAAAARYGAVAAWTPVNEPLTTARFSCLYGYWYPHAADESAFLRAIINQCRAILLAMRAIRAECPAARFVHTEDIGRVFATAPLSGQARYENDRRWLSLDALCGRLDREHPWWNHLLAHGVAAVHLEELSTGEASPDAIGVNHYVTSDRFLDHRTEIYPAGTKGGNGEQVYVDTEAVRVEVCAGATGWEARLREVWQRYRRPMVVTEAHLGCDDPVESVSWLLEAWSAARTLRAEGADLRAVTAWALFGLVDWDSMLRCRTGRLEAGALGSGGSTILADAIRSLATTGEFAESPPCRPGWWHRADRFHAGFHAEKV